MTPDQYKAAAQAISELIMIGTMLPPDSKTPQVLSAMKELNELREALEAEGMKSTLQSSP